VTAAAVDRQVGVAQADPVAQVEARGQQADRDQQPEEGAGKRAQGSEDEPAARPPRRATSGRSRRSSVPSWDEIMLGNSRQPE
jgi:hypothetical protein